MKHDPACLKASLRYREMEIDYLHRWPRTCPTCGGTGGAVSAGCSVPYGMGSVNLPDEFDICPDCIEEGICPRCGKQTMADQDSDAEHCTACGWTWGESLPEPPECSCWAHKRNDPYSIWSI